ncbi:diaminopimelate decarboxylase [Antrihabitans cavernicola]|uniref:Diaminopimelate decarboxylase n=1 Tax=Antrihabitans cavernicola TaxID=2495913 RepID=A0A5A7SE22_9NOCA|nr:diaminopimelate decarboxylase [Spelaeibacter cavernicola]KAA0022863.1 diaminopimelate decarboxylase [Spelaeibacter cavernicola]
MTLLDILPSLRSVVTPRLDPAVWPADTHYDDRGRVTVGTSALEDVADRNGTPTVALCDVELQRRVDALRSLFPFARVNVPDAVLGVGDNSSWVVGQRLSVMVESADALATALTASVAARRITLHDTAAHVAEAADRFGADVHIGRVVLDSTDDLQPLLRASGRPVDVMLDVRTGEDADAVIAAVVASDHLRLTGVHWCPSARFDNDYGAAIGSMIATMAQIRYDHGVIATELGLGCADANLAAEIDDALDDACGRQRFPRPNISVDPGESLLAGSGIALFRIDFVEPITDGHTFVWVDGSPSDALTDHAVLVNRHPCGPQATATILARSGREIAGDVRLPLDVHAGEVLAIPLARA